MYVGTMYYIVPVVCGHSALVAVSTPTFRFQLPQANTFSGFEVT